MLSVAAKDAVSVCTEFQLVKAPCSSIATLSISKSTKIKREALWQTQGLTKGKRAPNELMLRQSLKRIFPNEEIFFKVRKALNIKQDDTSSKYLEIDASIPRLKFHVEYQDPYHYTSIYYTNRPLETIRATDAFKKKYLAERGESLLQLPCWWDGTDESLVATIKTMRPDLLQHHNSSCPPVPETEPDDFLLYETVPDVGPLMQPVYFSKKYYSQGSVWLGNEKLDGVRCCWNHKKQKLYSRTGKELRFPEEFKQHMPDSFLDGEVWFGRGKYSEAPKLCKIRTSFIDWPSFRISVFDIAGTNIQNTYTERYIFLHSIIPNGHPFLFIPSVFQVQNEEQRLNFEILISNNGGEGMILTEKNSLYVHGQTPKVLKVKPSLDKEALVVSIDSDYLTLQLTDGTRFRTHIPNIEPLPRVRDVITLSYNRCVQGSTLPVKPQIQRVRGDMTWSEVVASANKGALQKHLGRDYSTRWDRNLDDLRGCFMKFAQDNNFDALVPANWYNVNSRDIIALPGASSMLKAFNGSVINALVASFPEIGLDKLMFSKVPSGYWKDIDNIRKWFDQFAKRKGFDPLVAQNWYSITRDDILATKSGYSLATHFSRSYRKALVAAYPEIGLDESMFTIVPRGYWKDIENVRKWFDQFAKQKGFDPHVAHNWYFVTRGDILTMKGGDSLTTHFSGSHISALVAAYPEIGLDESTFSTMPNGYWKNIDNVRNWFDQFAKRKGFDPLVAHNWYSITREDISSDRKTGSSLVKHFSGSHIKVLIAAYPEIGLNESMFTTVPRGYWQNIDTVRKWFDQFAQQKGFDPLVAHNWYSVTRGDILAIKGGYSLAIHFGKSHIKALVAAYPDIGLDESMFAIVPHGYWKDIDNVRKWFDQLAKQKGFDPLVAQNWYSITRDDILSIKGGNSIIVHFSASHIKALIAAYPDIGLDESMFATVPHGYWKNIDNIRKWFDQFAKQKGFNPLVADNWYSIASGEILAMKGGNSLTKHFGRSHITALAAAYPEIGLDKSQKSIAS